MKAFLYILLVLSGSVLFACRNSTETVSINKNYLAFSGKTMGTSYNIVCLAPEEKEIKKAVDSILYSINNFVSTYEKHSLITKINKGIREPDDEMKIDTVKNNAVYQFQTNNHFDYNIKISSDVYQASNGYFDPTIMPLVNFWGFGYKDKKAVIEVDSQRVSDLLQLIGFDKWAYKTQGETSTLSKPLGSEIDFSAVAKGYAVDYISNYLEKLNIDNYLVEIGGEVFAKGTNKKGNQWTIGLNTPAENAPLNSFEALVQINGVGLASSGNYRNFYEVDGKKYGHEINPKSGFPEMNELLGVSVIAMNCALADAYATAFMIMGLDNAFQTVEQTENLEAVFFFGSSDGLIAKKYSSNFKNYLKLN